MTVTCSHCGEILILVPIIGKPDGGWEDFLGRILKHLQANHSKPAHNSPQMFKARKGQPCTCKQCASDRIIAEATQKAQLVMGGLIGQAMFGQFTSNDEEYNTKKREGFEGVLKIVMEFEPKGTTIAP